MTDVDTVVVVAGGARSQRQNAPRLTPGSHVIGADSGIDHALALGYPVHQAIGDFDSVSADGLAQVERWGATVTRHPEAKDATDLELAIDAARSLRPRRLVVVGGQGGRLDHLLANLALLAHAALAGIEVEGHLGDALVTPVHDWVELAGERGSVVSLLPMHGPALGVTTDGLRYPLRGEDLPAGTSRGMSNELMGERATVTLGDGVLLAIQPGAD